MARYTGIKGKVWDKVKQSVRRREQDCYTCPAKDLVSYNSQAGHYKPVGIVGSNNVLSWHPIFIHLQCGRCNGAGQGMAREYEARLRKEYGDEVVDWFESNYHRTNPVKDWNYIARTFETWPEGSSHFFTETQTPIPSGTVNIEAKKEGDPELVTIT